MEKKINYTEELEKWFDRERRAGRVKDVKFFPGADPDGSVDKMTRAVFETVTGVRKTVRLDISKL